MPERRFIAISLALALSIILARPQQAKVLVAIETRWPASLPIKEPHHVILIKDIEDVPDATG
jgi:hypothetical protein